jgi:hypothetical protein
MKTAIKTINTSSTVDTKIVACFINQALSLISGNIFFFRVLSPMRNIADLAFYNFIFQIFKQGWPSKTPETKREAKPKNSDIYISRL